MPAAFTFILLLVLLAVYAVLIWLAAKAYKKSSLPWRHAIGFSVLIFVASAVGTFLSQLAGRASGPAAAVALGFAVQLVLGGWYLGPRLKTASGEPAGFKGGALVSAVAYGLVVLLGTLFAVLVPILSRGRQA